MRDLQQCGSAGSAGCGSLRAAGGRPSRTPSRCWPAGDIPLGRVWVGGACSARLPEVGEAVGEPRTSASCGRSAAGSRRRRARLWPQQHSPSRRGSCAGATPGSKTGRRYRSTCPASVMTQLHRWFAGGPSRGQREHLDAGSRRPDRPSAEEGRPYERALALWDRGSPTISRPLWRASWTKRRRRRRGPAARAVGGLGCRCRAVAHRPRGPTPVGSPTAQLDVLALLITEPATPTSPRAGDPRRRRTRRVGDPRQARRPSRGEGWWCRRRGGPGCPLSWSRCVVRTARTNGHDRATWQGQWVRDVTQPARLSPGSPTGWRRARGPRLVEHPGRPGARLAAEPGTALSICLSSRFRCVSVGLEPDGLLQTTRTRPAMGDKHPDALGWRARGCGRGMGRVRPVGRVGARRRGRHVSEDEQPSCAGTASWRRRTGRSPMIEDESGGIDGVFIAVSDTTTRVVGERRRGCSATSASLDFRVGRHRGGGVPRGRRRAGPGTAGRCPSGGRIPVPRRELCGGGRARRDGGSAPSRDTLHGPGDGARCGGS